MKQTKFNKLRQSDKKKIANHLEKRGIESLTSTLLEKGLWMRLAVELGINQEALYLELAKREVITMPPVLDRVELSID